VTGFGFGIVPSADTAKRIIRFQRNSASIISLTPTLGMIRNRPHLTLYQGAFADDMPFSGVLQDLSRHRCWLPRRQLTFTGVIAKSPGWLFLLVKRDNWLTDLQATLMESIGRYLVVKRVSVSPMSDYSPDERRSIALCGYRYTGAAFLPHVTLGKTRAESAHAAAAALNRGWQKAGLTSGDVGGLTFYQMGENGAHAITVMECAATAAH
jgi:hypothetical protein